MALENFGNAAGSKLNNLAAKGLNKLPASVRGPAGALLDQILPGLGGNADYSNNSYSKLINKRLTSEYNAEMDALIQQGGDGSVKIASPNEEGLKDSYDWRARLRPKKGGEGIFYGTDKAGSKEGTLMEPIIDSGGLVWQYTPSIYLQGSANYNQRSFQGANYPINSFNQSQVADFAVTSDFTANDQYEARYFLAMTAFLKAATKAHFGDVSVADGNYGMPPPVLLFEYLGEYGFNKVPVVVVNYSIEYPREVDYVPVRFNGTVTYVPTKANVAISLSPTYTPHKLRKRFDIESIANGTSYKDGFV